MFFNEKLQERYSRILEHLSKIDCVISETLGLTDERPEVTESSDLPDAADSRDPTDTTEVQEEVDREMDETECADSDMIDADSGMVGPDTEDSEIMEVGNGTDAEERVVSEPDSDSRAVSEEDVAYEGPEIVIDAQDEAETE